MMSNKLLFNALTFDWPSENPTFYFSKDDSIKCTRLHGSLFPHSINTIFPGMSRNDKDFIYTTFTYPGEGFIPLQVDFKNENPDLIKRFYNWQLKHYFFHKKNLPVKTNFVKDNQVWVHNRTDSKKEWWTFDKFTLKIQFAKLSKYPELVLSFDGQSKVLKRDVGSLIQDVDPECVNWVLLQRRLCKWEQVETNEHTDYSKTYPVLNKSISEALGMALEIPRPDNRYPKYHRKIVGFYNKYLNDKEFKDIIPINNEGFIAAHVTRVFRTSKDSNQLVFGSRKVGINPRVELNRNRPYKPSPYKKTYLFYIFHEDRLDEVKEIHNDLMHGIDTYKGIKDYAGMLIHTAQGLSIRFSDIDNPLPEIEDKLSKQDIIPEHTYIAIYITPHGKYETDQNKRKIYYHVKELLLKRGITSQVIDPAKRKALGTGWKHSLPNIYIAILAKLEGIPWQLNTPEKNELVVGVGAFKDTAEGVQYIASAFSFENNGKFTRFEYFLKDEVELLAGSIASAIKEFATVNSDPDRLIIHFYKEMSEREFIPIMEKLENLELHIPVCIITVFKTESEDIVAFDTSWPQLMPLSGTFINIGSNQYLLFNNTRYSEVTRSKPDGFPFPIKIKMQCSEPGLLKETKTVNELIDQVYQFSRMYWKSVKQQNLPVTIKYPEMVAQIAPNFKGNEIPDYGKRNLWFL
jgi:hypothetical protein